MITGRAADVVQAARTAFDVAIRLIKPGKKVRGRGRVCGRGVCGRCGGKGGAGAGGGVAGGRRSLRPRLASLAQLETQHIY